MSAMGDKAACTAHTGKENSPDRIDNISLPVCPTKAASIPWLTLVSGLRPFVDRSPALGGIQLAA